ncbi:hypothetical protein ACRWGB_24880, partial [Escherichia coli]
MAAIAPSLSTSTQTRVSASSCKVEFRHGNMTLENPSPELLTVLIREPRQPGGCKLKTAPVRPVVAARPAEYVCSEDL